jgi:predicted GIY-YIG superfamily endonuclease
MNILDCKRENGYTGIAKRGKHRQFIHHGLCMNRFVESSPD